MAEAHLNSIKSKAAYYLQFAAEAIREFGHARGAYINEQGNLCAIGSLNLGITGSAGISSDGWVFSPLGQLILDRVVEALPKSYTEHFEWPVFAHDYDNPTKICYARITEYNDSWGTRDSVISLLEAAADKLNKEAQIETAVVPVLEPELELAEA